MRSLAKAAGVIKARNQTGILTMVDNGEVEQSVFPLLCVATWGTENDADREARREILRFFGYDRQETLQQRLRASELLTDSLWHIAQTTLQSFP